MFTRELLLLLLLLFMSELETARCNRRIQSAVFNSEHFRNSVSESCQKCYLHFRSQKIEGMHQTMHFSARLPVDFLISGGEKMLDFSLVFGSEFHEAFFSQWAVYGGISLRSLSSASEI